MHKIYTIEGASHSMHDNQKYLTDISYRPNFQEELNEFKNLIIDLENKKQGVSFVHFGDGDYFFLKKIPHGSAMPGKRALSIDYNNFDITPFKEGWKKADYHCIEVFEKDNMNKLQELYPGQNTLPTEFLYGLLMNKWFLKMFKGKIGLLGAGNKLELIKELMKHEEYQEYLGLTEFNDYIHIPQKYACDNLDNTIRIVKEQLENSNPDTFIYLYGVGHVKSGLIHHLPKIKNAIYLDVGAGIDALAGLIDPDRPFAAGWINHRMKDYNYNNIDLLQYNKNTDKSLKYI